jgi:cytosine permease
MTSSQNAIGLIETRGIVALMAGIEAMMKTADVETVNIERIGSPGDVLGFRPDHVGRSEVMDTLAGMMGMVGALTLTNADFSRYARTARDVRIMAVGGAVVVNFGVVVLGALLYQAGDAVVAKYLQEPGRAGLAAGTPGATTAEKVQTLAHGNAGAYFVVLAGLLGFLVMYAAQIKAQVINAYTSSLSMTNLAHALTGKAPSRVLMMVVANVLALLAVWGDVLSFLGELLGALGIATCSLIALLVTDFKLVRGRTPDRVERFNWAGVIALAVGFGISYWLFWADIFELGFLITLVLTPAVYLGLRRTVLPPGTGTTYVEATAALREIDGEENPVTA